MCIVLHGFEACQYVSGAEMGEGEKLASSPASSASRRVRVLIPSARLITQFYPFYPFYPWSAYKNKSRCINCNICSLPLL